MMIALEAESGERNVWNKTKRGSSLSRKEKKRRMKGEKVEEKS